MSTYFTHCFYFLLLDDAAPVSLTEFYKAAVVEFAPKSYLIGHPQAVNRKQAENYMKSNLDSLEVLVKKASKEGAKIIVFPENSITGRIFCKNCKDIVKEFGETIPNIDIDPKPTVSPCENDAFVDRVVLQRLSCFARDNKIVLVANMPDKQGDSLFQTNVIFEADGTLIKKYHKQHLFKEESEIFTIPTDNTYRHIKFPTSFGIDFSVFICYDILFCDPPLEMVNKHIKNFVYSAYWGNRYPHFMSNSVRQGWSWRNKVNILCAGINNKFEKTDDETKKTRRYYSSGSGIYSAGKPVGYYINGEEFAVPSGKLVIAEVPKEPGNIKEISDGERLNLHKLKSPDTPLNFIMLNPSKDRGKVITKFINKQFWPLQCTLEYQFEHQDKNENYALAASIYPDNAQDAPLYYALCSLSLRPTEKNQIQETGYSAKSKFKYLKIRWIYVPSFIHDITVNPIVLGDKLRLLDPSYFNLEDDSLSLKPNSKAAVSILTVNLLGKIAGKDDGYCSSYTEDSYCEIGHESACGG